MGAFIDLSGQKFGLLTVVSREESCGGGLKVEWLCRCECGKDTIKKTDLLKRVKNIHCGCLLVKNKLTKVCALCKIEKDKSDYHPSNTKSSGIQAKCKECTAKYKKDRYWSNREAELEKLTASRLKPENVLQRKSYYVQNKEQYKKRYLKYMSHEEKRNRKAESARKYNSINKDKIQKRVKFYNQKDHVKKRGKEIHALRKQSDLVYNIKRRLRFRLRNIIVALADNKYKYKSAVELLGCDMNFFKSYIESKFTEGMSWERMHELHIDHIKPCAKFDLTKIENQKKCFHYSNLQPLWSADNLSKSDKYNGD